MVIEEIGCERDKLLAIAGAFLLRGAENVQGSLEIACRTTWLADWKTRRPGVIKPAISRFSRHACLLHAVAACQEGDQLWWRLFSQTPCRCRSASSCRADGSGGSSKPVCSIACCT